MQVLEQPKFAYTLTPASARAVDFFQLPHAERREDFLFPFSDFFRFLLVASDALTAYLPFCSTLLLNCPKLGFGTEARFVSREALRPTLVYL